MGKRMATDSRLVVAIPVHNEEAHIGACLASLARQDVAAPFRVVALLNNCTDASGLVAGAHAVELDLHLRHVILPPDRAHAGTARRQALDLAAAMAAEDGVLFTTDADTVLPPDWLSANLAAIAAGADAVAGRAEMAAADAARLPGKLVADEARAGQLGDLLDEIDTRLDPDPADPWPRHTEHSGASIAVTAPLYRRAGGIPPVRLGEDRAFFAALRRVDARIRHAPDIAVTVSGRLFGRAEGGMADTIRRRLSMPDAWLDDRLEPAADRARRARLRALLRRLRHAASPAALRGFSVAASVPPGMVDACLARRYLGEAWADIESCSPVLQHHRVAAGAAEAEITRARQILARLGGSAHPAGSPGPAAIPA